VRIPSWARLILRTPWPARASLAQLWVRRTFRPSPLLPEGLPASPRLLFVCHGNILRSAAAEALFLRLLEAGTLPPETTAGSAGVHATEGKPADPRGINVARELGIRLDSHRARRLTETLVAEADLILAMDRINEAEIATRFKPAAAKVRLLGFFDPDRPSPDIPDPFLGDEEMVRTVFRRIESSLQHLAVRLGSSGSN
jgi:protein-tyrosine-phosphatase